MTELDNLLNLVNECRKEVDRIIKEKQEFVNTVKQHEESTKEKLENELKIIFDKLGESISS
jgi:hypothetical protein